MGEVSVATIQDQAGELVAAALGAPPVSIVRQALTSSGNAIFRIELADGQTAALRVSPRQATFAYTAHNLEALRKLGLPVQRALASGPAPEGGSFILLSWLPGRDLQYELPTMRAGQMTQLAGRVVEFQRRVMRLPESNGFGWAPIGKNAAAARWTDIFGPPAETDTPAADTESGGADALDHFLFRLRKIRASIEHYFASVRPTCFLDDLTTKNLLVKNGILQGIIDVDFVCYGDALMSAGTTLAEIAANVGDAGAPYGEALVRHWNPSPEGMRAVYFYAALWLIGFLKADRAAGSSARADVLSMHIDRMLRRAEAP